MEYNDFDCEMEMPTPCEHCGQIFDLNDGYASNKWHEGITICSECHEKEEEEMERDGEIEDANFALEEHLPEFIGERGWENLSDENKASIIQIVSFSVCSEGCFKYDFCTKTEARCARGLCSKWLGHTES